MHIRSVPLGLCTTAHSVGSVTGESTASFTSWFSSFVTAFWIASGTFLHRSTFGGMSSSILRVTSPRSPNSGEVVWEMNHSLFMVMKPSSWMVLRPSRLVKPFGTTINFTSVIAEYVPVREFVILWKVSPKGLKFVLFSIFSRSEVGDTWCFLTCFWPVVLTSAGLSSWNLASCSFTLSVAVMLSLLWFTAMSLWSSQSLLLSCVGLWNFVHFLAFGNDCAPLQLSHVSPHAGHFSPWLSSSSLSFRLYLWLLGKFGVSSVSLYSPSWRNSMGSHYLWIIWLV